MNNRQPTLMHLWHLLMITICAATLLGCGGSTVSDTAITTETNGSATGVLCDYKSSVFNTSPSVNATATATWSCTAAIRKIVANGLPDHEVGSFPNPNNPNTISAQSISASIQLNPTVTSVVTPRVGPMDKPGIALNGVIFDPGTAGTCDNTGAVCDLGQGRGSWNIEALGQSSFKFGTDANNAHVQPGGVYHYHGVPEGFVSKLNKGSSMTLIGWAADGFPIYARYGYSSATDITSALKTVKSSYQLKKVPDSNRPSNTLFAMGAFTQDYEFVAGSGDLDECNGRTGVTPEFPKGTYHYFATDTFPHLQRCVKGSLS